MDEFVDATQTENSPLPKRWALRFFEKAKGRAGALLAESRAAESPVAENRQERGAAESLISQDPRSEAPAVGSGAPENEKTDAKTAFARPAESCDWSPAVGKGGAPLDEPIGLAGEEAEAAARQGIAPLKNMENEPEKKLSFAEKNAVARVAQLDSGVDWSCILSELMQERRRDLEYARKKGDPQLFDALDREEVRIFSRALASNEKIKKEMADSKRLSGVSLSWWTAYWRAELAALGDLSRAENHQVAKASVLSAVSAWEGEKLGAIIQAGAGAIADATTRKEVLASGYLGGRENSDKVFWKEVQEPGPMSEKTLSLLIGSGLVDPDDFPCALSDILGKERKSRAQGKSWPDRGWIARALMAQAQDAANEHVAFWSEQVDSEDWRGFSGENEGWAGVAQRVRELAKNRSAMELSATGVGPAMIERQDGSASMARNHEHGLSASPEQEPQAASEREPAALAPLALAPISDDPSATDSIATPLEPQALRPRAPEVSALRTPGAPVLSGASAAARVSAAERAALRRAAKGHK